MGNNIGAMDESTELKAMQIAQEIDFTDANMFLKEVLFRIGVGRYKLQPQFRDLNLLKAAISITSKRMLTQSVQQVDEMDIVSSYKSKIFDTSDGYKKITNSKSNFYLKNISEN